MNNLPALPTLADIEYGENYLALTDNTTFEAFQSVWETLTTIHGACPWWIGDAINEGERKFGEVYAQAVDLTSLKYDTLSKYAWVARSIPKTRRRPELSFTHHLNAMRAPEDLRDDLLTKAIRESLSTRDVDVLAKELKKRADSFDGESMPIPSEAHEFRVYVEGNDHVVYEVAGSAEIKVAVFPDRGKERFDGKSTGLYYQEIFLDALKREGIME